MNTHYRPMVMTRTGKGQDNSEKMSELAIEQLCEEVNRLTALVNASSKENVTLREQIKTFQKENLELNTKLTSLSNKQQQTLPQGNEKEQGTANAQKDSLSVAPANAIDSDIVGIRGGNTNTDLVNGILDHFKSLQVNITFDVDQGNPAEFIEKIEKYFKRKNIKDDQ